MAVLSGLEPEKVFYFFEELCKIPHGSGDTKRISDYCVAFAKERGLDHWQDEHNNVIIWKNGTKGCENKPWVMLQGHMDMVCEKEEGCSIDFTKDGLALRVENGMITAEGTTLGGDDGIAVAMTLALLDADDITHPPLEAVFTVDEEIGMLGAAALDMGKLRSKIMINMDSEDEGFLLVSCAGGVTAKCELPVKREAFPGVSVSVTVEGLLGGHSGQEIDKGRANANVLLGRALSTLQSKVDLRLQTLGGGNKDNAIPRRSEALIVVKDEAAAEEVCALTKELCMTVRAEYAKTDPDAGVFAKILHDTPASQAPMDESATKRTIAMLRLLPQGIQRMSADVKGLVQTSLNLGILKDESQGDSLMRDFQENPARPLTRDRKDEGEVVGAGFSVRSSVDSEKEELCNRLETLMEVLDGSVSYSGAYGAWQYRADSPLREKMLETYRELFQKDMTVYAIHAGVECGLFSSGIPGLDAVSIGPEMKDIHTPQERLEAASVARTWEFLLAVLRKL
ncbi:MAG: aminoacyl-histidine dipeptidase [Lachnospiraceae bacterium]|nr:aminoacyl-histidine dipeptidase [Lachnospiraceae bacterium]